MPVIHFTESDKLAGKVLEKGTYRAILVALKEPVQSSSKKSFTYVAEFKLTEGVAVGKKLEVCFNTETSSSSVLGNRQYAPTRDMLKLAAAVKDVKFDDIPLDFDSDEILNKPLDLLVDTATSEGNIVNFIAGYAPEGKGTPAF